MECIQDPPGVSLYMVTGSINKGGETLQVLRCARGTTLLESFHLNLAKFANSIFVLSINYYRLISFIPGRSANLIYYQAYLLEGLTRWNQACALAAIKQQQEPHLFFTFDL